MSFPLSFSIFLSFPISHFLYFCLSMLFQLSSWVFVLVLPESFCAIWAMESRNWIRIGIGLDGWGGHHMSKSTFCSNKQYRSTNGTASIRHDLRWDTILPNNNLRRASSAIKWDHSSFDPCGTVCAGQ